MAKATREEIIEKKKKLAEMPDSFVVVGTTLEARWLIRRIREYDKHMKFIKTRIGRTNFDNTKALKLIEKAQQFEDMFKSLMAELRDFVNSSRPARPNDKAETGDNGKNVEILEDDVKTAE